MSSHKRRSSSEPSQQSQKYQKATRACDRCHLEDLNSWFKLEVSRNDVVVVEGANDEGPSEDSCNHCLCAQCLAREHAKRGCGPLLCPVCANQRQGNCVVLSTTYVEVEQIHGRQRASPAVLMNEPTDDVDPFRHFLSKDRNHRQRNAVVAMMYHDPTDSGSEPYKVIQTTIPMEADPATGKVPPLLKSSKDRIQSLFIKLHGVVMGSIEEDKAIITPPPATIVRPLELFAIVRKDVSFLYRLVVSLATGKLELFSEEEESGGYWTSDMMALWIATEMIRRIKSRTPGLFQQVLADHLKIHQSSKVLMNFLSRVRLSASMNYIDLKQFARIDSMLTKGWELAEMCWGVLFVFFDNLGFRIRGASVGYDQRTMIQVKFVTKQQLVDKIPRAYDETNPISRERKSWSDIRSTISLDAFVPGAKELDAFSERVCLQYQAIMGIIDELPESKEECEALLATMGGDLPGFTIPEPIHRRGNENSCFTTSLVPPDEVNVTPDEYDMTLAPSDDRITVETSDGDAEFQRDGTDRRKTMYEINNIKIDVPWALDLACDSTSRQTKEYALHLRKEALKEWMEATDEDERDSLPPHKRPVMFDYGISSSCDGSPSYSLVKQRDADPEAFKHHHNESGPFHAMMKLINCRGLLLGDAHVANQLGQYRKSDKSVDYVLFPSDPSQFTPEHIESMVAIQVQCIRAAAALKDDKTISCVVVVDFTVKRAKEEPLFFLILIDLRLADIIWMIRDTENTGENGCDPELYRMGLKLAAVLYAASGAYKYVRIIAEFFKDRLCWSELDEAIYNAFLFTQDTVNGKKVWTDKSVEWMMKDVRFWLGKHYQQHHDALLARLALSLNEMKGARVEGVGKRAGTTNVKSEDDVKQLMVTKVFLSTMVWAYKLNLVGPGPITYLNGETTSNGYEGPFLDPTGEFELNWGLLSWWDEGIKTFKNYMKEYYVSGELHQVSRPNRTVSVRRIPARKESLQKRKEEAERFFKTEDASILGGDFYNKDDLIDQLRKENQLLREEDRIERLPAKSKKKAVHAEALARVRKAAHSKSIDLSSVQEYNQAASEPPSEEAVATMLDGEFYSLTGTVRERFSRQKFTIRKGVGGNADGDAESTLQRPGSSGGVSTASSAVNFGPLSLTQSSTQSSL